ncbi:peptidylprolyl isomerase [Roseivirga pacifica]|uniref:peptidylprolyl isomerase n=1 Tax=Roseivirga pacifica TaxID=1267423 RepID=UPI002094F2E0|nr:peptidylprolyl isomerase [Roseivirga pacifica]MCO6359634.1 peptidylprolyl isomerase [Roseivirga pacifica]MCO6367004.1 peptidylprolyl isomerase [Roseivirga pacifica]MCO6370464.1 peptidylprolyl isomerase [Roseivirga pacifica]MCO6374661.1 peptidylprolyl isomerase [Roseivirga pacifica]MCO6379919.1 peptidylprolyl isomerase [Roseivirga pacifica]
MNNRLKGLFAMLMMALVVWSCGGSGSSSEGALEGNDYLVTIKTNLGEMKAILHDETPKHKENFVKLANEGFFDSLLFHRVIPGFMIQGGDPNSKNAQPGDRLGNGGPGYTVPAEFNDKYYHKKGALSAARQSDAVNPERESSGSQFYIVQGQVIPAQSLEGENPMMNAAQSLLQNQPQHPLSIEFYTAFQTGGDAAYIAKVKEKKGELAEATGLKMITPKERIEVYSTIGGSPWLDEQYTVFGQVISGLDVVDAIAAVQTNSADRPSQDVRMFVTVEELPKKEIAERYGNPYIQ